MPRHAADDALRGEVGLDAVSHGEQTDEAYHRPAAAPNAACAEEQEPRGRGSVHERACASDQQRAGKGGAQRQSAEQISSRVVGEQACPTVCTEEQADVHRPQAALFVEHWKHHVECAIAQQ